ncbi:MAG: hypothetical protein EHM47_08995 [Ignavibacteriales bacterium]|nr:MAG: hypothetical protein EHM47_08995 [Ignavibacteriales bacterium]
MLRTVLIILIVVLIGSWVAGFIFWGDSKEKIEKAEKDLADYKEKYAMVIERGDSIETIISGLRDEEFKLQTHIDSLETVVVELKEENERQHVRIANLFQPDDLVDEMKLTFPELRSSPMGIGRVPHPETGFTITTFQLPVQFVATFIEDHREVDNFKKQIAALGEVNFTYKTYVTLQDSIISLKEQKAQEYLKGMEYGLAKYEEVMKEYIQTLKEPPRLEWPSVTSILAAAAAGIAAGVLIAK